MAREVKSGSRLPLKHFHTSAARIHISNPIYSEALAKLKKGNSFFFDNFEPKKLQLFSETYFMDPTAPILFTYNVGVGMG